MAVIDWLGSLRIWLLAIVLIVTFGGWTLLCLAIARRFLPKFNLGYEDAYFAAASVQSVMLLYSLIAALTAVGVWQRYAQISATVSNEAGAIAILWRDLGGYPQPSRDALQGILRDYTQQVMNEAWPKQRRGEVPQEGVEWMDRLQAALFAFEPQSESQKIIQAETLRAFGQLVQQRRQRLDSIQGGLPGVLWLVLLPGAFGCIALFTLLYVRNPRLQSTLLLGVAAYLVMGLLVIIALDHAFSGETGITADSYRLVFEQHMKPASP